MDQSYFDLTTIASLDDRRVVLELKDRSNLATVQEGENNVDTFRVLQTNRTVRPT
jgi:hypothetical protein